jgi:hypothetical protein
VDQQFESDVMQDLMGDSPSASADAAYAEEGFEDGFEGDGMEEDGMMEMDGYDEHEEAFLDEEGFEDGFESEYADEFAEEAVDEIDALEEAVADALDAEDSDEFLARLIGGIRNVAGAVGRGAGAVRRVAGTAQRVAGQVGGIARGVEGLARSVGGTTAGAPRRRRIRTRSGTATGNELPALIRQMLPILQQHARQGADEMELFEDLADWYEETQVDEALPLIAGVAARAALRPMVRRGAAVASRAVRRQLVRGATQAARQLAGRQGARGVRALSRITRSVGRTAVRRGLRPANLPTAIRQTTARIAAQPGLVRRLSQPGAVTTGAAPRSRVILRGGGTPRRFVVNGPVEIIVQR